MNRFAFAMAALLVVAVLGGPAADAHCGGDQPELSSTPASALVISDARGEALNLNVSNLELVFDAAQILGSQEVAEAAGCEACYFLQDENVIFTVDTIKLAPDGFLLVPLGNSFEGKSLTDEVDWRQTNVNDPLLL